MNAAQLQRIHQLHRTSIALTERATHAAVECRAIATEIDGVVQELFDLLDAELPVPDDEAA